MVCLPHCTGGEGDSGSPDTDPHLHHDSARSLCLASRLPSLVSPLPRLLLSLAEDGIAGGDVGHLGGFTPCSRVSPMCAGGTHATKPRIVSVLLISHDGASWPRTQKEGGGGLCSSSTAAKLDLSSCRAIGGPYLSRAPQFSQTHMLFAEHLCFLWASEVTPTEYTGLSPHTFLKSRIF